MTSTQENPPEVTNQPGGILEKGNNNDSQRKSITSLTGQSPSLLDLIPPNAEAVELYWSRGLGTDEYGCPAYFASVIVRCPYCRKTHSHGLGLGHAAIPADDHGGHRVSDGCHPRVLKSVGQGITALGYYITGLQRLTAPEYPATRCRELRGAPQNGGEAP